MKNKGFTLIELLVVISIIGTLSSIVLASLSSARTKALDRAAFATGEFLTNSIFLCDSDGGKITTPNSTTNPTNDFCGLGPTYGAWSKSPQGWVWVQTVWVNGTENLMGMTPNYGTGNYEYIHCGYYPPFSAYCGGAHVGLCRLSNEFNCTYLDRADQIWK